MVKMKTATPVAQPIVRQQLKPEGHGRILVPKASGTQHDKATPAPASTSSRALSSHTPFSDIDTEEEGPNHNCLKAAFVAQAGLQQPVFFGMNSESSLSQFPQARTETSLPSDLRRPIFSKRVPAARTTPYNRPQPVNGSLTHLSLGLQSAQQLTSHHTDPLNSPALYFTSKRVLTAAHSCLTRFLFLVQPPQGSSRPPSKQRH